MWDRKSNTMRLFTKFARKNLHNWITCYTFAVRMKEVENPYIVQPEKVKKRVRMIAVPKNPMDIVNTVTGEVERAMPIVGKRAWRDISSFVKIFDVKALICMKSDEVRVFLYCMEVLDFDGKFLVDIEKCKKMTGLCRSSIYRGLERLTEKDAIRRDGGGRYWINPNIAYRGSRDELMDIL